MRTAPLHYGVRVAAVAALALATALGGVATAGATARDHHGNRQAHGGQGNHGESRDQAPRPIEVKIGAEGIQAPKSGQAGLVAFRVKTNDPDGRFLQAFRPHRGVTTKELLADLKKAISQDPQTAAEGISAVRHDADALGGAQVTPSVSETFTTPITAGQVVLLDFTAFLKDPAHPVVRTLELRDAKKGKKPGDLADFADSIVITRETTNGPRFDVHGLRKAKDNVLVRNSSDELHEMAIQPVAPGTTDDDITAFFDGNGPAPFTGPSVGLGIISPGRTVLLETHHLPPGTYALLCFVPDDETGIPHVVEGMHQVVVLT
ncbi:hypothetical protein ABZZ20_11955 [Streptomyces sp. NPDC006430]|uniref:hypothetical protein n=1 Tax=Streptomyces sp. NPDC006430 TaxID=3154299 RepID=UPI0033A97E7D